MEKGNYVGERISMAEKNKNNKKWYEDKADMLDTETFSTGNEQYKKMQINYDLFNGRLHLKDFSYVCNPFGSNIGELPAKMENRDIVSGKIKALLGMEMKRSFQWKAVAVNPEATTRKEQEQTKRIKEYVTNEILRDIRTKIEQQKQEEIKGRQLSPEEQQQIQQQIEEETKAMTPQETKLYMKREHQDPAEILANQLAEYLIKKCDLERKFSVALKDGLISAREVMYVGILNGEPEVWNVNPLRFRFAHSSDITFIEDADYATCEYIMSPSEVIKYFGRELNKGQIDKIYKRNYHSERNRVQNWLLSDDNNDFAFESTNGVRVLHCVWKSLRRIGFLHYLDEENEEQEMVVDENYKLNKDQGDIRIEWEWIPEVYETWKILDDIYVNKRPIPGQFKDINNLYESKLPYYGLVYDNRNSIETSLMDRMKPYQYYYNIIWYKLELLFASDKGKKVLMNINAIPDSLGIDIKKWQYFMESTPLMWFNPNEEDKTPGDANTVAKVLDLSLVSDINKYIEIAEYLRQQCGKSVGITDQVEGQISQYEGKANVQTGLIQSGNILEPFFNLHNYLKRNVLQALLETAKIAYSENPRDVLTYVLDDMSVQLLKLDMELLDNSTLGIFISNSAKVHEIKDLIQQLTHAALQSQKVEFSDVISVIKKTSIEEAEDVLKVAEDNRRQFEMQLQQQQGEQQKEILKQQEANAEKSHEREKELIVLKEEERRKTEVVKGSLIGASYNPDVDRDNDGENDYFEIAKHGLNAEVQKSKLQIEREKLNLSRETERRKLEQKDKELELKRKQLAKKKS